MGSLATSRGPAKTAAPLTGFTIVELMVVIGVIGILLSLTFPALRTLRLSALNTSDLSQIRQLGLAHRAYQQVHNDWFVDVGLPHGGYGEEARSFVEVLEPYIGTEIMQSPLDESPYCAIPTCSSFNTLLSFFSTNPKPGHCHT